ncbi:hypothetical protein BC835DRAFT_1386777 [Cytidiella melzeri]|nr:hypothetical protein BC835DRAFT_1386777 [Cytidiella melzeri]
MFLLSFFICRRGPCLRGFPCTGFFVILPLSIVIIFAGRTGRPRCPPLGFLIGRSPSLPLLSGCLCSARGCRRRFTSGGYVEFVFLVLLFSLWVGLSQLYVWDGLPPSSLHGCFCPARGIVAGSFLEYVGVGHFTRPLATSMFPLFQLCLYTFWLSRVG